MKYLYTIFWLGISLTPGYGQAIQTQSDSYTRYELLDPGSQEFRIIYDVSATTPGAKFYFNTLRIGSEHRIQEVIDLYSGEQLNWEIVDGSSAEMNGLANANPNYDYLQIKLARPVPKNGETRLRIDKTYRDTASYYSLGEEVITFNRSLGIKRNSVVLPLQYALMSCNYPVQVQQLEDGRIKLSFMNRGPQSVPLSITAKKIAHPLKAPEPKAQTTYSNQGRRPDRSKARLEYSFLERAFQNREIVYFLQQPETHSFRLYHDYTETRVGMDRYLNVVRVGSKASNPSAYILDTGEQLKVETLKGQQITSKGITLNSPITENTEVVAIWYPPVKEGTSTRLRIEETYTDPNRYVLHNEELIWDRSFGRNRNTVILPEGWILTTNSIPGIISLTETGLSQIDFVNDRPGNIDVFIKAQRIQKP